MRCAYLDCISGISGDMMLGALADAGAPADQLSSVVDRLGLKNVSLRFERVERCHIRATKAQVEVRRHSRGKRRQPGCGHSGDSHHHRSLSEIVGMIERAGLSPRCRDDAARVFRRLGEVEAHIHGIPLEKVHFHEVGAEDSLVDIVASCAGLEMLGVDRLTCSPLDLGSGSVDTEHGRLPVPAPATAQLLAGAPVFSSGVEAELVTPTGAALVATLASGFGPLPRMKLDRSGYGAGTRELAGRPNVLRLFVGEPYSGEPGSGEEQEKTVPVETISVLEANVDDMNPQIAGFVAEKALAHGALDVFFTPVQMKKGRPGLLLTVLAAPSDVGPLSRLLFEETSTIGVRTYRAERLILERSHVAVETLYGPVRVKVSSRQGEVLNFAPEYEDCRRLAEERRVPLKRILERATAAYLALDPAQSAGRRPTSAPRWVPRHGQKG